MEILSIIEFFWYFIIDSYSFCCVHECVFINYVGSVISMCLLCELIGEFMPVQPKK